MTLVYIFELSVYRIKIRLSKIRLSNYPNCPNCGKVPSVDGTKII